MVITPLPQRAMTEQTLQEEVTKETENERVKGDVTKKSEEEKPFLIEKFKIKSQEKMGQLIPINEGIKPSHGPKNKALI